ncbi:YcjF family protein [Consotaella aegiceratis]|uniref:YcjF family protein n=1 Tax=Consotaella aegiceratis TaxID=3097961 RepID=UPI002F3F2EBE
MTRPPRRPGAFRIDDRDASAAPEPQREPDLVRAPRAVTDLSQVAVDPEDTIDRDDLESLDPPPAIRRKRGFSFGKLFMTALGALISLAIGLAIDSLIRDLFARADWLGWVAIGLTALLLLGALGVFIRESIGLMRLAAVDRERRAAQAVYDADFAPDARAVVVSLSTLLSDKPETAEGRARLASYRDDVLDGRDLIVVAERELLLPLDLRARSLVLGSAKRVSVVTAVSPRALVDVAFVFIETLRLIRQMSELYGARPGTIGLIRLTRDVLAHLAVTGSIAVGDSLVQQVVGHGLAARLSARLGEGVVNGLLTARVGIAAMDLCRPMPFLRVRRPRVGDFINDLASLPENSKVPRKPVQER